MERIRLRLGLTGGILMLLTVILLGWYGNIDKVDTYSETEKTYMNNEWKVRTYGATGVDDYEVYYVTYTTTQKTRTIIPFIYNREVLSKKFGKNKAGNHYLIERDK